jgi:hypothetical protein
MLARLEDSTRCTSSWLQLHQEYGLGKLIDNKYIAWSRDDLKQWRLLVAETQPAHVAAQFGADRTELAKFTANEKLSKVSIQATRLFCHSINAPLYLTSGEQTVYADVEYRAHYQNIDINRYTACLIIENQESFIYCQRFIWTKMPATLVLYRGHDKSTHALQSLLDSRKKSMDVYLFPDADPAGLNIAMSTQEATHIITPNIQDLDPKASVRDRFATQLQRNPNLQSRSAFFSLAFQSLVTDILHTGTAVSQEWLCAHKFPLELINLHD